MSERGFGFRPGPVYRTVRRLVQATALFAILVAPFLGGFQRNNRADMAAWEAKGFDVERGLRRLLPVGDAATRAHELNLLKGGGIALDYFDVAVVDPLSGTLALVRGGIDTRVIVAWLIPIALGLVFGRAFCGWLCPFGTLARWLDAALSLLPFRHRIALPKRRPLRFAIVLAAVIGGAFGAHLVLYLALPYVLLQHGVYAAWLLGGSSAALGLLVGLLLAGALFGPTTYCATLCPTGAVLSVLGRARRVHLTLDEPKQCGHHCAQCSQSCWLQLNPAGGDPGPDCDLCGRCVPACPRTNLVLTTRVPHRKLPVVAAALVCIAAWGGDARADTGLKPRLVLDAERVQGNVTLAVSVVDVTGVELVQGGDVQSGSELSVFLRRGSLPEPDEHGLLPEGQQHDGPLAIEVTHDGRIHHIDFEEPNYPESTQRRAIYRSKLPFALSPGDSVRVLPVAGFWDSTERFTVPEPGTRPSLLRGLGFVLAGFLGFGGLMSLSLGLK